MKNKHFIVLISVLLVIVFLSIRMCSTSDSNDSTHAHDDQHLDEHGHDAHDGLIAVQGCVFAEQLGQSCDDDEDKTNEKDRHKAE